MRSALYIRWGVQGLVWLLLTWPILEVSRRASFRRGRILGPALVHVAMFLAVQVVLGLADRYVAYALFGVTNRPLFYVFSTLRLNGIMYALLIAAEHGVRNGRASTERTLEAAALRTELAEAQLEALRSQLQPHFLFNALHDISELVYQDPARAERALARVGDLLRASLATTGRQEVSLREELEVLEAYLEVQRMRFPDELTIRLSAPEECLDLAVPTFVLQPLVENAVRHGTSPERGTCVEVTAALEDGALRLTIADDGPGWSEGAGREGTGLRVTRARLRHLYGPGERLGWANRASGGAEVTVRIPRHLPPPAGSPA